MTIDEVIDILSDNHTVLYSHGDYTEQEENEALSMAIKSLEAWEKIRKEIASDGQSDINAKYVLNLIDKHLAEVENDD